jgi:hypothetical protein
MSQVLKGHVALISLGLLAATSPADAAAATQDEALVVSPTARWLQLAMDQPKPTPMPKMERLDLPKRDLPKQTGAPAGPSKKTDLTPPDPNKKPVDQTTNVKLVTVQDPKFGSLNVPAAAKAAYLSLPPSARARLSDPKGGALVSVAALQQMAVHFRGFKPPPPGDSGSGGLFGGCGGPGQPISCETYW